MEKEQKSGNHLKRKTHTIRDAALEAMMVSSELSGREECQETIKGYANDKPIFINTKFVVFVEPVTLNRFHHTKGSLITLSVNGREGLHTIKVIEPCQVVLKAIEKSIR